MENLYWILIGVAVWVICILIDEVLLRKPWHLKMDEDDNDKKK